MQRIIGSLLLFIIVLGPSGTMSAEKPVLVKDDRKAGVRSEVFLEKNAQQHRQGETNDDGYLLLPEGCKQGEIILAKPTNPLYYKGKTDCNPAAKELVVVVTKKKFLDNLVWNAEGFEKAGDWGIAALAYNEIASRLEPVNKIEAEEARQKVYLLLAKHMKAERKVAVTVFDPIQKKRVVSPDFAKEVEEFQFKMGIPVSGRIDYRTLSTAAGEDIDKYIFGRKVEISGERSK